MQLFFLLLKLEGHNLRLQEGQLSPKVECLPVCLRVCLYGLQDDLRKRVALVHRMGCIDGPGAELCLGMERLPPLKDPHRCHPPPLIPLFWEV